MKKQRIQIYIALYILFMEVLLKYCYFQLLYEKNKTVHQIKMNVEWKER